MNEQIFIPEKINVGFQKRSDTYTGKLGYVIYYDNKGVLRKEKSWEGWRNKDLGNEEFKNEPVEGFVINRGGGGVRESYGWNARHEFVRVYDPRNFEFEISIANLLYILQECNSVKGKGLEGKFVYGWFGTTLCLLPVNSPEYQKCQAYTALQDQKVSARDLVPGRTYETKKQEQWLYMGRFPWYEFKSKYQNRHYVYTLDSKPKHVFILKENFMKEKNNYRSWYVKAVTSVTNLAKCSSEDVDVDFAKLMDKLQQVREFSKPKELVVRPITSLKAEKPAKWDYLPEDVLKFNTEGVYFAKSEGSYMYRSLNVTTETEYSGKSNTRTLKGYTVNEDSGLVQGFEDKTLTIPKREHTYKPHRYFGNNKEKLFSFEEVQTMAADGKFVEVFVKNELGKEIPLNQYL